MQGQRPMQLHIGKSQLARLRHILHGSHGQIQVWILPHRPGREPIDVALYSGSAALTAGGVHYECRGLLRLNSNT